MGILDDMFTPTQKGRHAARKILRKTPIERLPNKQQLAKLRLQEAERRARRMKVARFKRKAAPVVKRAKAEGRAVTKTFFHAKRGHPRSELKRLFRF